MSRLVSGKVPLQNPPFCTQPATQALSEDTFYFRMVQGTIHFQSNFMLAFDLQVNGYAGIDFNQDELTLEQLLQVQQLLHAIKLGRFWQRLSQIIWRS